MERVKPDRILLFIVFLFVLFTGRNLYAINFSIDNFIVTDTVFVYDTIWTYEVVYDTVFIYDTVYIEEKIDNNLIQLKPIETISLGYSPSNLLFPVEQSETVRKTVKKGRKTKKVKKKYVRYQNKYKNTGSSILTLNPTKGKFDPELLMMGTFSLEAYANPVVQITTNSYSSYNENNRAIEDALTDLTSWEAGVLLNYDIFQISFSTGLVFSQLREKIDYEQTELHIDSTRYTTQLQKLVTFYDTVSILNIDEYMQGNIVYEDYPYQYDSIVYIDSNYYVNDTSSVLVPTSGVNSHVLLEVPLLFSYRWRFARSAIELTLGAYNQFHLYSKGVAYSSYSSVIDINDAVTSFTKYNLALYGSIGYEYDLSRKIAVNISAFGKIPIRRFCQTFNGVTNKQTYGVKCSINYRF